MSDQSVVALKSVNSTVSEEEVVALKEKLDAFLKAKYEDGTLTALAEKYSVGLNTEALSK